MLGSSQSQGEEGGVLLLKSFDFGLVNNKLRAIKKQWRTACEPESH